VQNAGGWVGAWIADLLLYLFGVSAYWWVALCLMIVVWGYRRLDGSRLVDRRPIAIALSGFALLVLASASLEAMRLQSLRAELPLAPGGMLGATIGGWTAELAGYTGATLLLIALAAAGLKRLGLGSRIGAMLEPEESLPAPGQGALAIECRGDRDDLARWLAPLGDAATAACVRAERAVSRELSGSCRLPLGAFAEAQGGELVLRGLVASADGARVIRAQARGDAHHPEALGKRLAQALRAKGADAILAAIDGG